MNTLLRRVLSGLRLTAVAMLVTVSWTSFVIAEPPALQSDGPIIYLADNLDEKDNLGWCIDTLGRGQSDRLQAHSCKPQRQNSNSDADIKFEFDRATGKIMSATYAKQCMTLLDPASDVRFGLLDCTDDATQSFDYNEESGSITPVDSPDQCVAVGENSRSAGPYMSRALILVDCAATEALRRTWIVLE